MKITEQDLQIARRHCLDCYETYAHLRASSHDAVDKFITAPEPSSLGHDVMEQARRAFSAYAHSRLQYDLAIAAHESPSDSQ